MSFCEKTPQHNYIVADIEGEKAKIINILYSIFLFRLKAFKDKLVDNISTHEIYSPGT